MINRRPYTAESVIAPGCAVVQGSVDNQVTAPTAAKTDFIGVFPYEAQQAGKETGDPIGIVVFGIVKVLLGGNAAAGKKAVLSKTKPGAFEGLPSAAGTYSTCGLFLESGAAGEYVDMFIERGSVTVAGA